MSQDTIRKPDNTAHLISKTRRLINEYLVHEMEEAGIHGFVPSHGDIICTLFKHPQITMTKLAKAIQRDRSTVTTLVKKLQQFGYVLLQENPKDTRSRLVSLTDKGRKLKDEFHPISVRLTQSIWQGISKEDRMQFRSILDKIIQNFS